MFYSPIISNPQYLFKLMQIQDNFNDGWFECNKTFFVESYYKKKILIEKLNTPKFEILASEATVYMISF